ncbi:MAG: patatin-like phospholipase family protein [Holophagales bacterium]|nr:patatin-like phospholipase family protein [Holophagales bacterium]
MSPPEETVGPSAPPRRTALVLSGGGAFGVYEVGVLLALGRGLSAGTGFRPLEAGIVTGTSVGAFNAAFLGCRGSLPLSEATEQLLSVWRQLITSHGRAGVNGVYRFRLDPRQYLSLPGLLAHPEEKLRLWLGDLRFLSHELRQRWSRFYEDRRRSLIERLVTLFSISSIISTSPLMGTLHRAIDFDAFRSSPRTIRIIATDWLTGSLEVFGNRDLATRLGPELIRGSASIPGVFPAVPAGPWRLMDGGILMNAPLEPAIRAGATEVHLIRLFPSVAKIPIRSLEGTLGALGRSQISTWAGMLDSALQLIEERNRSERLRHGLRERLGELGEAGNLPLEGAPDLLTPDRSLSTIVVHSYHPPEPLAVGTLDFLDFSSRNIARFIRSGYEDAVHHDCERAGCVLTGSPSHSGPPPRPKDPSG